MSISDTQTPPSIVWVFATEIEAKAVVDVLKLKKRETTPFSLYGHGGSNSEDSPSKEASHFVLITGMGSVNAAVATAWLAGRLGHSCVWLNVGIAGHGQASIGDIRLAHSVSGPLLNQVVYPAVAVKHGWQCSAVQTQLEPNDEYSDVVFDMEASAFVSAARKFASIEFVHVIKVVSDNPEKPLKTFVKADCVPLIRPHVGAIQRYAQALLILLTDSLAPENPAPVVHFRMSHSQQRIISELIAKLKLADSWQDADHTQLLEQADARSATQWLQDRARLIAPRF